MKILHVSTTINRGGAENHILDLVIGQVERGHEVSVAYLKGDGYWTKKFCELGVKVLALNLRRYGNVGPLNKLRSYIRKNLPDVVHAHMPPAELYTRLALVGAPADIDFVITKHIDGGFLEGASHTPPKFLSTSLALWVAGRAKCVIAVSKAVKDFHIGPGGRLDSRKLQIIPHGIDTKAFEQVKQSEVDCLRKEFGFLAKDYIVGTVARLMPQKGLSTLLQGFAHFVEQNAISCRLIVVGSGPLIEELKSESTRLGVANLVTWAGFREDIPQLMCLFDVFALTSEYEGFGIVLLEAMSSSTPIVATRVSAIPEVVGNDGAGILIPTGDSLAFAQAIEFFVDDGCRILAGEVALERVKKQFDVNQMVDKTLRAYNTKVI